MKHDSSKDCQIRAKTAIFFSSIVGYGGSEVLFADAIQAASQAGINVICYTHPKAALREIITQRSVTVGVRWVDWPPTNNINQSESGSNELSSKNPSADSFKLLSRLQHAIRSLKSLYKMLPTKIRVIIGFITDSFRLAIRFRIHNPNFIIVNVNGSESASFAGRLANIYTVNCYHLSYTQSNDISSQIVEHITRRLTSFSSRLTIHTSFRVRDEWCRKLNYRRSRTRIIYNGVDFRQPASPTETRTRLNIPRDICTVCIPGRLDPIKGHYYLLQSLELIKDTDSNIIILICGKGSIEDELKHFVQTHNLTSIVRFLGWRNDLPDILAASDIVVLPSIASENLSVAVLEGLMAGKPAIVTDVGGMSEAVLNGVTGLVVPARNIHAMAHAILQLVRDPNLRIQMGLAAAQDAKTRFTRSRMILEYQDLYNHILSNLSR